MPSHAHLMAACAPVSQRAIGAAQRSSNFGSILCNLTVATDTSAPVVFGTVPESYFSPFYQSPLAVSRASVLTLTRLRWLSCCVSASAPALCYFLHALLLRGFGFSRCIANDLLIAVPFSVDAPRCRLTLVERCVSGGCVS